MREFKDRLNHTCVDCPAAGALCSQYVEVQQGQAATPTTRGRMQLVGMVATAKMLNRLASRSACRDIPKNLPALPETIPPVGSPELVELVSTCPSFEPFIKSHLPQSEA